MTVFYVVLLTSQGGTSSDASIARDRPHRGHLRRPEPGRQRRAAARRHADAAARAGGVGRRHGAAGRPGRWCPAGPQGVDVGARDDRRRHPHRSRRHAAGRGDRRGARPSGDGPVDVGHVPAGVHVRSCPPARSGHRRGLERAWAAGAGPGADRVGDRRRLDDLRGRRQTEAGCRVRLHQGARLPPAAGHPGRQR